LHHLTHEGLGGTPQKSHFKGKPVSASIKKGFSGQEALQIRHMLYVWPPIINWFFEVQAASTNGPAMVGKKVFPSLKTLIRARLGLATPATWFREQAVSQCRQPVHLV